MRHPIEICLTAGEWLEERRGEATARRWRRKAEKKTIATFISQGAVGGALGYFLLTAGAAIAYPQHDWLMALLFSFYLILFFGAILGSVTGILVWLPELLFKSRLRFVGRAVVIVGAMALLGFALSAVTERSETEPWTMSGVVVAVCLMNLPIVLMTGSAIRPCRLMLLGAGPSQSHKNFGSWLSLPAGFLLRLVSVTDLLGALMVVALWISNERAVRLMFPAREHLPAIFFAVFYFATSSYVSFRSPRKLFLLPIAILLVAPPASLLVYLGQLEESPAAMFSTPLLTLICLWTVYTLGRLLAPETPRLIVIDPWREAIVPQTPGRSSACQVQT